MNVYTNPKDFYVGQLLWFDVERVGPFPVEVLAVRQRVEIKILTSNNCIWVDKSELTEKREV